LEKPTKESCEDREIKSLRLVEERRWWEVRRAWCGLLSFFEIAGAGTGDGVRAGDEGARRGKKWVVKIWNSG
jgi:hypothetical protein